MKRDDALDALKNLPYDEENIHHDIEYIANKLGVSSEQMNEYLTIPKKPIKIIDRRIGFIGQVQES